MNQRTMLSPPPPPGRPATARSMRGIAAGAVVGVIAVLVATVLLWSGTASSEPPKPPPPTSDAEPFVQSGFADELSGEEREPLPAPETFSYGPTVDGCDHGYGTRSECVPYNFPPGVGKGADAKCAWLKQQGAGPLEVPGEDRHKLVPANGPKAPSGNPYACPAQLGTS